MGASNLVALFIIFATAATLHARGVTDIQTSSQAAEALRPIVGAFTYAIFAAGIIGTGLLAVPMLAGPSAYAVAETFGWRVGLDRKLLQAKSFYATLAELGMNFTALDPVKALYWSAVVNGVLAAPVMAAMMLIGGNGRIMGRLTLPRSTAWRRRVPDAWPQSASPASATRRSSERRERASRRRASTRSFSPTWRAGTCAVGRHD